MSQTAEYISRLSDLQEGERSRLRGLAGRPLDATLPGFDLFTSLWWPLRKQNKVLPRREILWLGSKLFGAFRVPHMDLESDAGLSLPNFMGRIEPHYDKLRKRFQDRFDALLCSSLSSLEPHLRWALGEISHAIAGNVLPNIKGIDWVLLLDDLWHWDGQYNPEHIQQNSRLKNHDRHFACRETHRTPQELWTCEYLNGRVTIL